MVGWRWWGGGRGGVTAATHVMVVVVVRGGSESHQDHPRTLGTLEVWTPQPQIVVLAIHGLPASSLTRLTTAHHGSPRLTTAHHGSPLPPPLPSSPLTQVRGGARDFVGKLAV